MGKRHGFRADAQHRLSAKPARAGRDAPPRRPAQRRPDPNRRRAARGPEVEPAGRATTGTRLIEGVPTNLRDEDAGWPVVDFLRRADLEEIAAIHDADAIGK